MPLRAAIDTEKRKKTGITDGQERFDYICILLFFNVLKTSLEIFEKNNQKKSKENLDRLKKCVFLQSEKKRVSI